MCQKINAVETNWCQSGRSHLREHSATFFAPLEPYYERVQGVERRAIFLAVFLSVVEAQMTDHVQMGQTSCMCLCTTTLHFFAQVNLEFYITDFRL